MHKEEPYLKMTLPVYSQIKFADILLIIFLPSFPSLLNEGLGGGEPWPCLISNVK